MKPQVHDSQAHVKAFNKPCRVFLHKTFLLIQTLICSMRFTLASVLFCRILELPYSRLYAYLFQFYVVFFNKTNLVVGREDEGKERPVDRHGTIDVIQHSDALHLAVASWFHVFGRITGTLPALWGKVLELISNVYQRKGRRRGGLLVSMPCSLLILLQLKPITVCFCAIPLFSRHKNQFGLMNRCFY